MKKQNLNNNEAEITTQLLYKIKSAESKNDSRLFRDKIDSILGGSNPKISIPKKSNPSDLLATKH